MTVTMPEMMDKGSVIEVEAHLLEQVDDVAKPGSRQTPI